MESLDVHARVGGRWGGMRRIVQRDKMCIRDRCYTVDQILTVLPHEMDALMIQPGKDYVTLVTLSLIHIFPAPPDIPAAHPHGGFRGPVPGAPGSGPACSIPPPRPGNPFRCGPLPPAAVWPRPATPV